MRRQAEAGIDVVNDGEMGKATWITYLYERVTGLEPRMVQLDSASILPPSRDRQHMASTRSSTRSSSTRTGRARAAATPRSTRTRRPRA